MNAVASCEFLPWDSGHFDVRIGRANAPEKAAEWDAVDDWANDNKIDCLYLFANGRERTTLQLAEERGGRCVDDRTILEAIVTDSREVPEIRSAVEIDLPELETIAASAFTESRFYRDPHFSRERCDEMYRQWIRKSHSGYAQAVLVTGAPGTPTGFVTCRDGKIDLLAVAQTSRGLGLGAKLTHAATHWFAQQGARRVSVLARTENAVAISLYRKCGFVPAATEYVFHKWYR